MDHVLQFEESDEFRKRVEQLRSSGERFQINTPFTSESQVPGWLPQALGCVTFAACVFGGAAAGLRFSGGNPLMMLVGAVIGAGVGMIGYALIDGNYKIEISIDVNGRIVIRTEPV